MMRFLYCCRFRLILTTLFVGSVSGAMAEEGSTESIFVTVGGGGHRMSSSDGTTWKNHQQWGKCSHDANDLMHVAYGNGVFVGVGGYAQPRVVVTADGKTWEEIDKSQFKNARGGSFRVLFVKDQFYLMSLMGNFLRSKDGRKWEQIGLVPLERKPKLQRIRDLAFGNGIFVGVGDFGAISASNDMGKTWTVDSAKHHGKDRTWPDIEFGDGKFVLVGVDGYTATSTDGLTWKNETMHSGIYKKVNNLCWTGKEFFAHGSKVTKGAPDVLVSKDGIHWTTRKFDWTKTPMVVYRFGDTYYGPKDNFFKGNTILYRSNDGETWKTIKNEKGYSARWMTSNQ